MTGMTLGFGDIMVKKIQKNTPRPPHGEHILEKNTGNEINE